MTIGYIGFTSLAKTIVKNAVTSGINVVVYDDKPTAVAEIVSSVGGLSSNGKGICIPAYTMLDFIKQIPPPRTIVFQVADAKAIDALIDRLLAAGIAQGDIFVDIGRSDANEAIRRSGEMRLIGCGLIDCGIFYDRRNGLIRAYVGGDQNAVNQLAWLWDGIAGSGGWEYAGTSGKGHTAAYK